MAELVDAADLGSVGFGRVGSTPIIPNCEVAERSKAAVCKTVSFRVVGSNPTFTRANSIVAMHRSAKPVRLVRFQLCPISSSNG